MTSIDPKDHAAVRATLDDVTPNARASFQSRAPSPVSWPRIIRFELSSEGHEHPEPRPLPGALAKPWSACAAIHSDRIDSTGRLRSVPGPDPGGSCTLRQRREPDPYRERHRNDGHRDLSRAVLPAIQTAVATRAASALEEPDHIAEAGRDDGTKRASSRHQPDSGRLRGTARRSWPPGPRRATGEPDPRMERRCLRTAARGGSAMYRRLVTLALGAMLVLTLALPAAAAQTKYTISGQDVSNGPPLDQGTTWYSARHPARPWLDRRVRHHRWRIPGWDQHRRRELEPRPHVR